MNEQFKAILPLGKKWSVTDDGLGYKDNFYPFSEIKKIKKQNEASIITNGVINVDLVNGKVINLVYDRKDKERGCKAFDFIKSIVDANNIASKPGVIYSLNGARGRHMDVYDDHVCISTEVTFGSLLTGNITDGSKDIFYSDVISVQAKEPSLTLGYIQLETASVMMNNKGDNFFNENTFTYNEPDLPNGLADEVVNFIKGKVAECKANKSAPAVAQLSAADEMKKFKELLDMGVITQEEFDAKKKQLLGL